MGSWGYFYEYEGCLFVYFLLLILGIQIYEIQEEKKSSLREFKDKYWTG